MDQAVLYEVENGIALLTVQNPPVNALCHAVRSGLENGLCMALADGTVSAIVLIGGGRTFPAGADITEFGKPLLDPILPSVCNAIEASTKPVVAALHGTALGGGFEIALAAHYRIADATARIGLPEVTLGILPGAGGTQRAPRLAGAQIALDLMLSGKAVPVTARDSGVFFDVVVEGNLRQEAIAFARQLIADGKGPRRTCDAMAGLSDPAAFHKVIVQQGNTVARRPEHAPRQIVRCVEAAALLPFEQGLAFERAAFEDCVTNEQSAALRHLFFAERRAPKFPESTPRSIGPLSNIGLVGNGVLAASLAVECLIAGLEVTMVGDTEQAAQRGLTRVINLLDRAISRKTLGEEDREDMQLRLHGHADLVALSDADIVLECSMHDFAAKQDVFAQLDAIVKEGAVLADAGSGTNINALAACTESPSDVLAIHFYAPLRLVDIAEVVLGEATSDRAIAMAHKFIRLLGKTPVRAFGAQIGARMQAAYRRAADYLVEDGSTPYLVDHAMRGLGMTLGPFQARDYEGLDTLLEDPGLACVGGRQVDIVERLIQAGRTGVQGGKGFYLYEQGATQTEQDPDVIALIRTLREEKDITPIRYSEEDIRQYCLAAMANEGARLLSAGIAMRPSDIDTIMVHAYGFPRWRGGPMKAAEQFGLLHMKNMLEQLSIDNPAFWSPDPVFGDLSKNGLGFDSMNG